MGHRVIALARSGNEVRAAVVETRLRRFELRSVLKFELKPVGAANGAEGEDSAGSVQLESIETALNRVLVPGLTASDSVAVSFPGDLAFIRRLSFPFKDRARIAEVLPVELAGTLPTGLDANLQAVFEKAGDEGNDIIAVGVQKEALAKFIESWKAEGVDPMHIGMESLELSSLLPYLGGDDDGPRNRMLIWIEGRKVEFLVAKGRSVILSRAILLTAPVFSGREVGIPFMREVLLSMAAASEAGAPLDRVHVAGSEAGPAAEALAEALSLECDVLDLAVTDLPGARNCSGLDSSMTRVVALATGMASSGGPSSLNLRTGEFSAEGATGLLREKARFFTVAAIVFALLGVGWSTVRYVGLLNDRKSIEAELIRYASTILEQDVTDFDSALATVRSGAREEIILFPTWTAVGTMEKLTRAVVAAGTAGSGVAAAENAAGADPAAGPAGVAGIEPIEIVPTDETAGAAVEEEAGDPGWAMELENLRIEPRQASFKGEAESIEKVDELMNRLRTDVCFHDIVTESTERIQFQRHQGWQRFSVRVNVDCAAADSKKSKEEAPAESDAPEAEQGGGE